MIEDHRRANCEYLDSLRVRWMDCQDSGLSETALCFLTRSPRAFAEALVNRRFDTVLSMSNSSFAYRPYGEPATVVDLVNVFDVSRQLSMVEETIFWLRPPTGGLPPRAQSAIDAAWVTLNSLKTPALGT